MDSSSQDSSKTRIKFDADDDVMMMKEVLAENPFEDGSRWRDIVQKMKRVIPKAFTPRNLRERINFLIKRFDNHYKEWKVASGKEEAQSERIRLLEEVRELRKEFLGRRGPTKGKRLTAEEGKRMRDEAALALDLSDGPHDVDAFIKFDDEMMDGRMMVDADAASSPLPQLTASQPSPDAVNENENASVCDFALPEASIPADRQITPTNTTTRPTTSSSTVAADARPTHTQRPLKRKRGVSASVEAFIAKKQATDTLMRMRNLELEERKAKIEEDKLQLEVSKWQYLMDCHNRMMRQQQERDIVIISSLRELLRRESDS